nr:MAG TPA: hypothetical protein [Caudoviricetes sp.]
MGSHPTTLGSGGVVNLVNGVVFCLRLMICRVKLRLACPLIIRCGRRAALCAW